MHVKLSLIGPAASAWCSGLFAFVRDLLMEADFFGAILSNTVNGGDCAPSFNFTNHKYDKCIVFGVCFCYYEITIKVKFYWCPISGVVVR